MATKRALRRTFLKTGGAAALAGITLLPGRARGANDRIGVGFIGTGSRAGAHIGHCLKIAAEGRCQPVAVCDVYRPRVEAAARRTGGKVYGDYRALLADKAVDAVCIATPDRLHAPQAIAALAAGKDVFVEKPLVHWSQMALATEIDAAAQRGKRIVQVGTQYVADDAYAQIRKQIADGAIGKVVHVQCGYFRRGDWGERMTIPDANARPGPDLDWEAFLGDLPRRPFDVSRFFQWRLYWDYAGGPATDLLVHAFTPVFCMLNLGWPERVMGGGGTFQYDREVPDQCNIVADYPGGPSVVMMNSLSNFTGIETMIRGTEGIIIFKSIGEKDNKGVRIVPAAKGAAETFVPWTTAGDTGRLWSNFLDCCRSRQQPYSPIDIAVRVQAPLNMGILSHREGKVARFDAQKQAIVI